MTEAMLLQAEETPTEEKPRFQVTDDQKAEWCLEKIREKRQEIEKWEAHYKAQLDQIRKGLTEDIGFFENLLAEYFTMQHDSGTTKTTKTQESYALPSGKLLMKHQEPEYKPNDEKLVPWLEKNNPEFIKVKKSADWAGLKKTLVRNGTDMITEDGEIVPGITVTPRPDIFKVEV